MKKENHPNPTRFERESLTDRYGKAIDSVCPLLGTCLRAHLNEGQLINLAIGGDLPAFYELVYVRCRPDLVHAFFKYQNLDPIDLALALHDLVMDSWLDSSWKQFSTASKKPQYVRSMLRGYLDEASLRLEGKRRRRKRNSDIVGSDCENGCPDDANGYLVETRFVNCDDMIDCGSIVSSLGENFEDADERDYLLGCLDPVSRRVFQMRLEGYESMDIAKELASLKRSGEISLNVDPTPGYVDNLFKRARTKMAKALAVA